jgi:hypothetical protein
VRTRTAWPAAGYQGLALAGAAALMLGLAVVPANGATSTSWRVVQDVGTTTGRWSTYLSISGTGAAWSAWTASTDGGIPTGFVVERWTGKTWAQVEVPPSLMQQAEATAAVVAISADDAWLIAGPATVNGNSDRVLRWNGSKWVKLAIPGWVLVWNETNHYNTAAVYFGAKDVWIFNQGPGLHPSPTEPGHYAARYNGRKWTMMQLPVLPGQVSALAPDDIWAYGTGGHITPTTSAFALIHWNGHQWLTVQVPRELPESAPTYQHNFAAIGPKLAYIGVEGSTPHLLRWNGRSWSELAVPAQISEINWMTQDGHGGLWLAGTGPQPSDTVYFADLNGGRWTVQAVPADAGLTASEVTNLSRIPGTQSVWAGAAYPGSTGSVAAMLKFGR